MAGDFELLSAYVALKTKGISDVFRDFARVRAAANQLSQVPFAVNMGQASRQASRFAAFVRAAQISLTQLSRNTRSAADHTARLNSLQASLQSRLASGNISQRQRLQLERLITQAVRQRQGVANREAAAAARAARVAEQAARQHAQAERYLLRVKFNSIELERRRQAAIRREAERTAAYLRRVQLNSIELERRRQATIRREAERTAAYLRRVQLNSIELERRRQAAIRREAERTAAYLRRVQINSAEQERRRLRQLDREANQRRIRQRQLLNSISLEAGFIAPFLRLSTNLFRISGAFQELARNAGFGARAIRLAGIAGTAFGGLLSVLQLAVSAITRLLTVLGNVALRAVTAGFRTLFGPTLAFIGLIQRLIANLPLVISLLGGALVNRLTDVAQRMQRITATFSFAFGTSSQAELSRIISLANRLGVPLEEIAQQYARITVAARDAGIEQSALRRLVEGVGAASVTLGLQVEQINGIFFAFEQIISKGRLASEELRRQLGDRLPGAFQTAARALGVTTAELDKLLEQGAIDARTFISAIGDELLRSFGPQANTQINRITAAQQRLRNVLFLIQGEIASRLEPALVRVVNRFTELAQQVRGTQAFQAFIAFVQRNLDFLANNIQRIAQAVAGYLEDIGPTVRRLIRLVLVLNTVAIGGLLNLLRRATGAVDAVVDRFERLASRVTGLNFETLESSILQVVTLLENLPLILEIVRLRMRIVVLIAQSWYEQTRRIVTLTYSLLKSIPFIGQALAAIELSLKGSSTTAEKLANIEREIATITAELELRMQGAFNQDRLERFGTSMQGVLQRMRKGLFDSTGVWLDFGAGITGTVASIIQSIGAMNSEARKSFDLANNESKKGRGSHSIVNITELRNTLEASIGQRDQQAIARSAVGTERNTASIADYVASLDKRISEMPDLVDAAIRASILALPGGGLSR